MRLSGQRTSLFCVRQSTRCSNFPERWGGNTRRGCVAVLHIHKNYISEVHLHHKEETAALSMPAPRCIYLAIQPHAFVTSQRRQDIFTDSTDR